MKRINARSAFWLAMAIHASAFAQVPVKPGQWELKGAFKGLPFAGDTEHVRTVCISETALGTIPEKALIEASPQPSDDVSRPPPPKCEYFQVRRDGSKSSWVVSCESPTMIGVGSATTTPAQVDLLESLEMKTIFGSRSMQHIVRARRLGDCS